MGPFAADAGGSRAGFACATQKAGLHSPYVLSVSLAASYPRFRHPRPADTAGLVLIDGSNERQMVEGDRLLGIQPELRRLLNYKQPAFGSPTTDWAGLQEFEGLRKVLETGTLGLPGGVPNVPMAVIVSTRDDNGPEFRRMWRSLQTDAFGATTHGMLILTDKSGHGIAGNVPGRPERDQLGGR